MFAKIFSARLTKKYVLCLKLTIFEGLEKAPMDQLRQYDTNDLLARFTGDVSLLSHLLPTGLANAIKNLVLVIGFVILLFYTNFSVTLYISFFLPLAVITFFFLSGRLENLASASRKGYAEASATTQESLISLRESRVTGSQSFIRERFRQKLLNSENCLFYARRYLVLMEGVLALIPMLVTMIIWFVGSHKVIAEQMSVGQLVSIMILLSMLYSPASGLFNAASGYVYELAAFKRLATLLTTTLDTMGTEKPLASNAKSHLVIPAPPYALTLSEIGFSYARQSILKNFNSSIPAAQCTAIIGANGSGKSTIVNLLLGLEQPHEGEVCLNSFPLIDIDDRRRANIYGYLPQDSFIFGGTLRNNITLGRPISDTSIEQLIDQLHWIELWLDWPKGLDTHFLERGKNLSGGQRQKVVLLRALINRPSILILDEPENNLEPVAITKLQHYLQSIKHSTTIIIVSHGNEFLPMIDHTINLSPLTSDCSRSPPLEGQDTSND